MSSRRLQRATENPTLELKIISANDVSYFDATEKMDVYAVVSIKGDNTQKKQTAKTPIDYDGGSNPTWNHTVTFSINEKRAREGLLAIHIKLFSYWLEDKEDLYLGKIIVSVQELIASDQVLSFTNGNVNKMKLVTYPVKSKGETKRNAKLSLSYRFKPVPVNNDLYPPPQELDYLPSFSQAVYPNSGPTRPSQPIMYSPQLQTNTVTKLTLELVIKFAKDLKKVKFLDGLDVYASVTIREDRKTIKSRSNTPIAYSARQNPRWDHAVKFSLDQRLAQDGRLTLFVELMSYNPLFGDKLIGEVNISIQELLDLNPPSLLRNAEGKEMMLVTQDVSGSYGKKGTLTFTYRFLTVQVEAPKASSSINNTQPFIMYGPVLHQEYASPDSIHGTSGYVTVHQGVHVGPSNGLVPISMAPPYQSHGYHQYSPQYTQSQLQQQPQQYHLPVPQQPQPQPLNDIQSQSYQSDRDQNYSSMQPLQQQQLHIMPPKQPTQTQEQKVKWQGGNVAALGVGAAVRAMGGALVNNILSDEVNIIELVASGL